MTRHGCRNENQSEMSLDMVPVQCPSRTNRSKDDESVVAGEKSRAAVDQACHEEEACS